MLLHRSVSSVTLWIWVGGSRLRARLASAMSLQHVGSKPLTSNQPPKAAGQVGRWGPSCPTAGSLLLLLWVTSELAASRGQPTVPLKLCPSSGPCWARGKLPSLHWGLYPVACHCTTTHPLPCEQSPLRPFLQHYKSARVPPNPHSSSFTHLLNAVPLRSCQNDSWAQASAALGWDFLLPLTRSFIKETVTHLDNPGDHPLAHEHCPHCMLHPACCPHSI